MWIGDAIVKGYIKIAPRVFVQHPKIDLQLREEQPAADAAANEAAGTTPGVAKDKHKFRVVANV